jgi:hypothetical protein
MWVKVTMAKIKAFWGMGWGKSIVVYEKVSYT